MRRLPQSTAYTFVFKVFLSSDHVTAATGKTVAVTLSKAGGAFANPNAGATNATEIAGGWYKFAGDTTDVGTLGDLVLVGTATGCDTVDIVSQVVAATNGGMTALPAVAAEAAGGLFTRGTGAGQINQPANGMIDANVVRNAGTAITAAAGVQEVKVASIAADAITAASIAADAIGSSELATTAVNEIRDAILSDSTAFAGASIAAIKAKTDNLPSDPADASDIAGAFATVNSTLNTIASYIDTEVAAIKAKTDNLPVDPADASDIAASFASIAATLATIASYVDTEVAAIKAKTDNLPATPAATGDAMALTAAYDFAKGTTAMAESYAANGVAPTPVQALFAIHQVLMAFSIVGTNNTVKKLDGSTTAFVATLDDDTSPTGLSRS